MNPVPPIAPNPPVDQAPPAPADDLDRLRPPEEARATVLAFARLLPAETVPLAAAAGRVLAEDLVADADQPPFAAATMDGYAVMAGDGSPWREVIGERMAGRVTEVEVTPGTAVRITTGAPVPLGADAVVRVEATEPADDHVVIHQDLVAVGENIRPVGFDLRTGERILPAGTVLGPAEIGLVAGVGLDPVPVRRRPRVSVLSTGDELVEPHEQPGPGQIRDSNRLTLVAALTAEGAEVVYAGHAPDDRAALRALLDERLAVSDVVVTSGGVSMGQLDLVKALLGELTTVRFRRVFMKPGKPLNFATFGPDDRGLFFGLPGNPVSALVGFEIFVRPALSVMAGRHDTERPRVPVVLVRDTPVGDRPEYQRAVVRVGHDGRLLAANTGVQASSRLASFVGANALIVVPPQTEVGSNVLPAGTVVEALLLAPPLGPDAA